MIGRNRPLRNRALTVITGTLDMLIASGQLEAHRLNGIRLAEQVITEDEHKAGEFTFLTDDQTRKLGAYVGICVWLQRTMGLRISEALGVEKSDFINGGKTLRVRWQASRYGKTRVRLKKRGNGQFRDIPVPCSRGTWSRTFLTAP
jgi:integrase